jgi:thiosulfate dehydrogenase [quinone] large subunit
MAFEKLREYGVEKVAWVGLRLALGWIFIWGFFDKLLGLGYSTASSKAWINGGSPTRGFLLGTTGPLSGFYKDIAGSVVVDWLFMIGLLFIGGALLLGIGMRITSYAGTLFLLLLWSSNLPPKSNPLIDQHIVYIFALFLISAVNAGQWFGLGKWWSNTNLVKRYPILR